MYALIENGFVKEIVEQKFPFAESENIFFTEFGEGQEVAIGDKYINNNFVKPTLSLEELKDKKIGLCCTYLLNTDWYCLRFADRGIQYPQEIKDKREQARNFTNDIEALTTKEEVESYNIDSILE